MYTTIFDKIKHKNKSDIYDQNGIYKMEWPYCNKCYVGQMKKKLHNRFLQHCKTFLKRNIYKLI